VHRNDTPFVLVAADVGHHHNNNVHRNATPFALVGGLARDANRPTVRSRTFPLMPKGLTVQATVEFNQDSADVAGSVRRNATPFALVAADVDRHYNNNRNTMCYGNDLSYDAVPITYATSGLDVNRTGIHSAIGGNRGFIPGHRPTGRTSPFRSKYQAQHRDVRPRRIMCVTTVARIGTKQQLHG
jgi:hypothetical protein